MGVFAPPNSAAFTNQMAETFGQTNEQGFHDPSLGAPSYRDGIGWLVDNIPDDVALDTPYRYVDGGRYLYPDGAKRWERTLELEFITDRPQDTGSPVAPTSSAAPSARVTPGTSTVKSAAKRRTQSSRPKGGGTPKPLVTLSGDTSTDSILGG